MNSSSELYYLLRKSPLVRMSLLFAFVLLVIGISVLANIRISRRPVITEINPPVGGPGDVISISGKHFGINRDSSYVEFNGNRLTSSAYIAWTDSQIKVIIPSNIQDGLVVVGANNNRSRPAFFTNERDIPLIARQRQPGAMPFISNVSKANISIGELIVLQGDNFGSQGESSAVYFSSERAERSQGVSANPNAQRLTHIPASTTMLDYEYWSNTEIRVYVPDGAKSGTVYVETPAGKSAEYTLNVTSNVGEKSYGAQRTYVLQLSADIDNVSTKEAATIRFFVPRPLISASQPSAELIESTPEPAIPNYQNAVVHQIQVTRNVPKRQFLQNFVVSVSEINTSVNVPVVRSYSSMNKELFALATKADKSVPASATSVTSLAKSIVGQETNPYKKARLIYEYMLSNYSLSNNKSNDSLDLIRRRRGNSYDFAIIYTSLLRSVGIPAFPVAGVLVERDMQTRNHWWCEFYITSLGWVPVDVALGAGLEYRNWINTEDVSEYYFGNLDAQHIAFSRGWNEIKPTSENSIIVQQQHSYAFQSIWEEASQSTIKYSSFWQNPIVLGIY